MSDNTAKLSLGGADTNYTVRQGTIGPDVIDIRKLYANTGAFTFDPGFMATAACESKITFIDGDKGVLLHRGYPIEELAEHELLLSPPGTPLRDELDEVRPGRQQPGGETIQGAAVAVSASAS